MKILLSGSTGFLGTHLLESLIKKGFQVILVKRSSTNLSKLQERFGNIEAWNCEGNEMNDLFRAHSDIDMIMHAATDYGRNDSSLISTFLSNEAFPIRLLEQAVLHKVGLFLNFDTFFSSQNSVYDYLKAYTLSKRHFREWGEYFGNSDAIYFLNLRLFHMYGPGDSPEKFIQSMVRRCLANEEIDLTDGLQMRDFIHVDDVISAVKILIESKSWKKFGFQQYDVGSGNSVSIRYLVETIKKQCRSNSKLNFGALPIRAGEFKDFPADIKALRAMGWKPKINIELGIDTLIDDLDSKLL
jgi:CDP-paratose synthetase